MSIATDNNGDAPPAGPRGFGLSRDAFGKLVLIDAEGRRHVGVEPIRAFPIAEPGRHVAICDADGRELAWVDDLATLPEPVRAILEEELAARTFLPVIERIRRVSSDSTPADWDVVTDRGPTRFTLQAEDDIRRLDRHRALIVDAQGIRYLIPDTRALDAASRRILERYF